MVVQPPSPPLFSCVIGVFIYYPGCFLTGLQPQPQQAVGSAANNYSTNLTSLTSSLSSLGVSAGTFLLLLLQLLLLLMFYCYRTFVIPYIFVVLACE